MRPTRSTGVDGMIGPMLRRFAMMGFSIYAAGSGGFRYRADDQADEGLFTAAEIISIMGSLEPSRGSVVEAGIDQVLPSAPSGYEAAAQVATTVFLGVLSDAVDLLAACTRASQGGWISVSPRETNLLWADTSRFARYEFSPGESPGSEFIQRILPALRDTDMNNYGVLRSLSVALSLYQVHIGTSGTPMIQIELTK